MKDIKTIQLEIKKEMGDNKLYNNLQVALYYTHQAKKVFTHSDGEVYTQFYASDYIITPKVIALGVLGHLDVVHATTKRGAKIVGSRISGRFSKEAIMKIA